MVFQTIYSEKLLKSLTLLYQVCVKFAYHPHAFKTACTIVIKKLGKDTDDKLIALLNTLGKTLKSIMAEKIFYLAERFNLLPCIQKGAHQGRSIKIALELLTEQIHKVAILLSIDIAGAFNTVLH